jgi:hypothetical protein
MLNFIICYDRVFFQTLLDHIFVIAVRLALPLNPPPPPKKKQKKRVYKWGSSPFLLSMGEALDFWTLLHKTAAYHRSTTFSYWNFKNIFHCVYVICTGTSFQEGTLDLETFEKLPL